jgi:hypothetical protein
MVDLIFLIANRGDFPFHKDIEYIFFGFQVILLPIRGALFLSLEIPSASLTWNVFLFNLMMVS